MKKLLYLLFTLSICVPAFGQTVIERGENYEKIDLGNNQYQMVIEGDVSNYKDDDGVYKPVDVATPELPPLWSAGMGFNEYYSKNRLRVLVDTTQGRFRIYPKRGDNVSYLEISAVTPVAVSTQVINNKYLKIYKNTANVEYAFIISDKGFKILYKIKNATGAANWANTLNFVLTGGLTRTGRQIKYNGNTIYTMPDATWWDSGNDDTRISGNMQESIDGTIVTIPRPNLTGVTYPVFIDPQLPTVSISADTFIDSALSTQQGNQDYMSIGNVSPFNRRGLGKFSFTSLDDTATITSATATFNYDFKGGTPDPVGVNLWCDRLLRTTWVENQANWTIFATGSNWGTAGADNATSDYTTTDRATTAIPAVYGDISFNVTEQVKTAKTSTGEVWHFRLRMDSANTNANRISLATKEDVDSNKHPELVINYTLPSAGNIYYISPTGLDTNSGTLASPWKTIEKFESVAAPLDTLYCRGGTYTGQNVAWTAIGSDDDHITIAAYPGETPIFTGSSTFFFVSELQTSSGNLTFDGLTIQNYNSGFTIREGNNLIFKNCTFKNMSASTTGAIKTGTTGVVQGDITVDNCYFENIGRTTGYTHDHALYIRVHAAVVIKNNYFKNCRGGPVIDLSYTNTTTDIYNNVFYLTSNESRSGIFCAGGLRPFNIYNNTFVIDPTGSVLSYVANTYYYNSGGNADTIVIKNNIIYYISTKNDPITINTVGSDLPPIFGNNLYFNATESDDTVNKLTANPLFVNLGSENFRLQSGSPAIDSGTATLFPSTDKDGNARPYGTVTDRGAYEYTLALPELSFSTPAVGGVTVTVGDSTNLTYTLASGYIATTDGFYYDTNESGFDGVKIGTGGTDTAGLAEGTDVIYSWDTTGITPDTYWIYGSATDDQGGNTKVYAPGSITINSSGGDPAPVATSDSGTTTGATPVVVDVSDNVTGSNIDWTTLGTASGFLPAYGNAVWDTGAKTVTYTATDQDVIWNGVVETFRYSVGNTSGNVSNSAEITITVNGTNTPPVTVNDSIFAFPTIPVIISVLVNDTDSDGTIDPTTVEVVAGAAIGNTQVNANGTITYTSYGSRGTDTFTYRVRDTQNGLSNISTVTVRFSTGKWHGGFNIGWEGGWR